MKVITLYEFQRRYLQSLSAEGIDVSPGELQRFFDFINETYGGDHDVLSLNYDIKKRDYYIKAHGSVGFAYYFGRTPFMMQVLPRPYRNDPDEKRSITFFLNLLNLSGGLGMGPRDIESAASAYTEGSKTLHELFFYLYVSLLGREVFRGMYREYRETEDNTKTIRGRVLLSRLVRRNPMYASVPVRHTYLSTDSAMNRVLKAALETTIRNSEWKGVRKAAETLLGHFHEVSNLRPNDVVRVVPNPLNERFLPAYKLAKLIIFGFNERGWEKNFHPGIFIGMDRLFEDLVYHTVRAVLDGYGVVYKQYSLPHVVKDAAEIESKAGAIFTFGAPLPDILIRTDSGNCIIEVKYRSLSVRIRDRWQRKLVRNSNELYQVYTYSKLSGGGAVIVYPRLKGVYNSWLQDIFGDDREVFQFFDGTPFGVFGYELSRIGYDVIITKNGVVLDEKLKRELREFLLEFCKGNK
ncbi:restriction endonuclease [Thermococcus siculi]|uniref:Restriction endonuclease n=1 Tax=Thermococcus siculi TaxID=72803 RepID=A0A2Z2MRK7_9EURY|nr:restriction endonuclease [Thermococcus siculi]ASJ09307.1 restriction endonuclease [Thermococcus siculi]